MARGGASNHQRGMHGRWSTCLGHRRVGPSDAQSFCPRGGTAPRVVWGVTWRLAYALSACFFWSRPHLFWAHHASDHRNRTCHRRDMGSSLASSAYRHRDSNSRHATADGFGRNDLCDHRKDCVMIPPPACPATWRGENPVVKISSSFSRLRRMAEPRQGVG